MEIRKAVVTAAGRGARLFPASDTVEKAMLPLCDRDGAVKPVLQIVAEEAFAGGIEAVAVICAPGDEQRFRERFAARARNLREAFPHLAWAEEQARRLELLDERLSFIVQREAAGYGHAVLQAREFVADEPFLLLLGDHLYVADDAGHGCAAQLVRQARTGDRSLCAVQATREHLLHHFGTVKGERVPDAPKLWEVRAVLEKPSIARAEIELHSPGLRAGHYLCFFGMYAFAAEIFEPLARHVARGAHGLGEALDELARRGRMRALEMDGVRHEIGGELGLLRTQLALGLAGERREEVLAVIAEALAERATRGELHA